MRLGISAAALHLPFHLVEECLNKEGINLTIDTSGVERKELFRTGECAAIIDSPNSLLSLFPELPGIGKIVAVLYTVKKDVPIGSDVIICQKGKDIRTAQKLHESRLGVVRGGLEHFLFEYYFFLKSLPSIGENYVWCEDRPEYAIKLQEGAIDAAIFCQPALRSVLGDNRFERFPDDQECFRSSLGAVLAIRNEFLDSVQAQKLFYCYLEGVRALASSDDATIYHRVQRDIYEDISLVNEIRANIQYEDVERNRNFFWAGGEEAPVIRMVRELIEFNNRTGYLGNEIKIHPLEILDRRLIDKIRSNNL